MMRITKTFRTFIRAIIFMFAYCEIWVTWHFYLVGWQTDIFYFFKVPHWVSLQFWLFIMVLMFILGELDKSLEHACEV